MDKVKIKKHDKHRFILTDTLPYETPLFFSNFGYYKILKKQDPLHSFFTNIFSINKVPLKSYEFNISKNGDGIRKLSIAHPASQLEICNLIHNNAEMVTYLCSKSNFSIRRPTAVASYYFEKNENFSESSLSDLREDDVTPGEILNDENDHDEEYATSYFSYDGYTLLYKFFDSLKFQSIEKKYTRFLKFDIAKCFNSIYTHSISWAIKGKEFSKDNIGSYSFDCQFDYIIRRMNENETNGIIIGPEFSRVFAEIILQRIDCEAEKELLVLGFRNKIDYEIKRYVDDFFVFTRSAEVEKAIYGIFLRSLSNYKLFVNESKEFKDIRPFITNLTIAKTEVIDQLSDFFRSIKKEKVNSDEKKDVNKTPSIQFIYKPYTRSNNLIIRFKSIVKKNEANYDAFSGLVMSLFRARLVKILNEVSSLDKIKDHSSTYKNLIVFSIDFLSFIFAMSIRVRTSHLMSQIFVIIGEIRLRLIKSDQLEIEKKLKDEAKVLTRLAIESGKPRVEFVNFLISLKAIFGERVINDELIYVFFKTNSSGVDVDKLDYFDLTSVLYLCCQNNQNVDLRDAIYISLNEKIENCVLPQHSSEIVHMLLDFGTFPYPKVDVYKNSLKTFYKKIHGTTLDEQGVNTIFNLIVSQKRFFVDWRDNISINKILQKKEMQRGYDL